ncbi:exodeoxyribonuclease III [Candidatus Xenohaliotis californiensis]|uniref:Exodeoxyribonuclease III n=1 Tax=Candidatus Xenohaliotis californiensis TaxID=84677 RepID=A0ABP0EWN6_9RICK|nr:exodeoxyribonuclease III [Candidatus Xenohaliotis californiensis]
MQLASWNVNSIKKRLGLVQCLLKKSNLDVLLLQELKCTTDSFPFLEIESMGYNVRVHGEKSYNGVACISKHAIEDVRTSLIFGDTQARYMECLVIKNEKAFRIINVYVPNGGSIDSKNSLYKIKFFDALQERVHDAMEYDEPLIVAGDYNVALYDIDVYSPARLTDSVCFHISMRRKARELFGLGMRDAFRLLHANERTFSWWDYRASAWRSNRGMRIDNILLSPLAVDMLDKAYIETFWRNESEPSDHVPIFCKLH